MAGMEQVPLLVDETTLPPPPPYQQGKVESPPTKTESKPVYKPETALPLPTYAQSQKYEQDGVLELSEDEEPDSTTTRNTTTKLPGSCLDFTLFFLICSILGLIGFIFSICFAFTVAAESGALAGLGAALIFKLFAFEAYDSEVVKSSFYHGGCEMYFGAGQTKEQCMHRLYYLTRLLFWFLGIFGVFLVCKGISGFVASRKSQPPPPVNECDDDNE